MFPLGVLMVSHVLGNQSRCYELLCVFIWNLYKHFNKIIMTARTVHLPQIRIRPQLP